MTYSEALKYLDSFVNYEELASYDYKSSFKLDRMQELSGLLGNPHKDIKTIHITGTKGKGSTAAIVSSILQSAGFKTGLYTSPHLISFRERIKIDGEEIKEGELTELIEEVKSAVDKTGRKDYTFFELYTAAAFLYFRNRKVDLAVMEVGLGGRLDATNLVEPLVACITPISLEHTHLLGSTLEDIAKEKAAIIKKGSVCVSAPQPDAVREIIASECKTKGVKLREVGKDIFYESNSGSSGGEKFSVFGLYGEYPHMEMGLLGEHQLVNAATAIGVIEALMSHNIVVPVEPVREGLKKVKWPGRLEIVGEKPLIVLDGAQNRASALALKNTVKKIFKFDKLLLILGISKDKDIPSICRELEEIADEVILTKADIFRAAEPASLEKHISKKKHITNSVKEAIRLGKRLSKKNDLILITGSLYVVGEARNWLMANK